MQALNLMRYTHEDLIRFLLALLVYVEIINSHKSQRNLQPYKMNHTLIFGLRTQLRCLHPKVTTNTNEAEEPANKNQQTQQELFYEVAEMIDESESPQRKTPVFILPCSLRQVAGKR